MFDNAHIRLSLTRGKKVLFSWTLCLIYVNCLIANNSKFLFDSSIDMEMADVI
jgi:hypothetical protein